MRYKYLSRIKKDIRFRIMLNMSVTLIIFIIGYFIFQNIQSRNNDLNKKVQQQELVETVKAVMQAKRNGYEKVVFDYSVFSWMVDFTKKQDYEDAFNTISRPDNIGFSFIQIYNLNQKLIYCDLSKEITDTTIIPNIVFEKLHLTKELSTFIVTKKGLVEIICSTIHPSEDYNKDTKPVGFVVFGKLWDSTYISELGKITNSKINVYKNSYVANPKSDTAVVLIKDIRFRNISSITICKSYPFLDEIKKLNIYLEVFFIILCIVILIVTFSMYVFLVSKPLQTITNTLKTEDVTPLMPIIVKNNEFGKISALIVNFFHQRMALKENLEQLNEAQKSLMEYNIELSERKFEIEEQNNLLQKLYEELGEQNKEVLASAEHLNHAHNEITESIKYARFIQQAVLASPEEILKYFPEYFIINKPKNIVSGDFYWFKELRNGKCILAVADCTGHGLSGSLLTMLGISILNETTSNLNEDTIQSSEILNNLRTALKKILHQEDVYTNIQDGMDISLCVFEKGMKKIQFSGAFQTIYVVRKNTENTYELNEYKGDRFPVGIYKSDKDFTAHTVDIQKNDLIYFFTDGMVDQFGGEQNKKFMPSNLKATILQNCHEELSFQENKIKYVLKCWKGKQEQTDDMMFFAVKIP